MNPIRLNDNCIRCIINKYTANYPENTDKKTILRYTQDVLKLLSQASEEASAPELVAEIKLLRDKHLGVKEDFKEEKIFFNNFVLSMEDNINGRITQSDTPLNTAVKYAMLGNYIDFGAMEKVDKDDFLNQLDKTDEIYIDAEEFDNFEKDLSKAKELVYLTDNCGEIVFDKLLISTIMKLYPDININVIVRGFPAINDVTMEDAVQTGLADLVKVTGNGTAIAGTSLKHISADALGIINNADVIISKGQGNFETLNRCGKNIYYLFLCKCKMFAQRFNTNMFSGVFINDLRMDNIKITK